MNKIINPMIHTLHLRLLLKSESFMAIVNPSNFQEITAIDFFKNVTE